jgi:hypothetical protein
MIPESVAREVKERLPIQRPQLTRKMRRIAMFVALASDFIQIVGFPVFFEGALSPFDDILDVVTAVVLLILCGPRWQFALAFVLELVPGLSLFPTWTTFVLALPVAPDNPTTLPPPSPNQRAAQDASATLPPAQQVTAEVVRVGKPS